MRPGTHPGPSNRLLISATWTLWNETLRRNDTLPSFLPSLRRLLPIYSDVKKISRVSILNSIHCVCSRSNQYLAALLEKESYTHEVNILIDWFLPHQEELMEYLAQSNIPINVFEPFAFGDVVNNRQEPCPIIRPFANMRNSDAANVVEESSIFVRKEMLPNRKSAKVFLIWVHSDRLDQVLKSLENSILWCPQKVDMGFFHKDTHFITVLDNPNKDIDLLFSKEGVRNSAFFAAVELREQNAFITNYNPYHTKHKPSRNIKKMIPYLSSEQHFTQEIYFSQKNT